MSKDYLIVNKKILPDYFEKVIEARNLLEQHEAATITEAVQKAGISRNTYYKYKDYIFTDDNRFSSRHAVISLILKDVKGSLASVIQELTLLHTSILTISQAIPVAGKATVLITLDITQMDCTIDFLIDSLNKIEAVKKVHLDAME